MATLASNPHVHGFFLGSELGIRKTIS